MAWVVTAVAAAFEVGATAAVIMTAVSEVGIAMTVVGSVTGNKDLMKIGGMLGIAGGIGGAAAGGMFGEAAQGAMNSTFSNGAADAASQGLASGALADGAQRAATEGLAAGAAADGAAGTLANTATGIEAPSLSQASDGINLGQWGAQGSDLNSASNSLLDSSPFASAPGTPTTVPGASLPGSVPPVDTGNIEPVTVDTGTAPTPSDGSLTSADGNRINNLSAYSSTPAGASDVAAAKSSGLFASAQQWLTGLKPQAQAEILKAAMAIPGGIQAQSNKAQELALQQQRINQTSYSSTPNYFGAGIIANAQKKV